MTIDHRLAALFDQFPNAEAHWGSEGIDIPWVDDSHIVVTDEGEDGWLIGVYLAGAWLEGQDHAKAFVAPTAGIAIDIVEALTFDWTGGIHEGQHA